MISDRLRAVEKVVELPFVRGAARQLFHKFLDELTHPLTPTRVSLADPTHLCQRTRTNLPALYLPALYMRLSTIFLDAAGTLITLTQPVGHGYAHIAAKHGIRLDPDEATAAFFKTWKASTPPTYPDHSTLEDRENIDRHWWKQLVEKVFQQCDEDVEAVPMDAYFQDLYHYYGTAQAWTPYPEVTSVLESLSGDYELYVFSNFDQRLVQVMDALGLTRYFKALLHSTALGACKPDPKAFHAALQAASAKPEFTLHVGDDPIADGEGAAAAGIAFFPLSRPETTLNDLLKNLQTGPD